LNPWRLRSPWARWGAKFAVILALALLPWPTWGDAWSEFYCEMASALADVAPTGSIRAVFRPGDDASQGEERAPWRAYAYLQQADTGAVDRVVQDGRMAYVSLATFLALAGASVLQGWKTRALWAIGLPALVVLQVFNAGNQLVLAVDRWHWIALGPAGEVLLSALYTLFNGLPVVPFALPGLLWWGLLRNTNVAAPWHVRREENV
jgi:hypothetical protein